MIVRCSKLKIGSGFWIGVLLLALGAVSPVHAQGNVCVDATVLPTFGAAPFDLTGFSVDGPEACVPGATADGWFIVTSLFSGLLRLDTCGTDGAFADTAITVYHGAACPLAGDPALACGSDECGPNGLLSSVVLPVGTGDSIYVRVSWIGSEPGAGTIRVSPVPPAGVDCSSFCQSVECAATPCFTYNGESDLIIDHAAAIGEDGLVPDGLLLEQALNELGVSVLRVENTSFYMYAAGFLTSGPFQRVWFTGGSGSFQSSFYPPAMRQAVDSGSHVYVATSHQFGTSGPGSYSWVDGVDHDLSLPGTVPILTIDGADSGLGLNFGAYQDIPLTPDDLDGSPHDLLVIATDDQEVASAGRFFAPDDSLGLGDYSVVLGAELFSGVRTIASTIEIGSFPSEIRTQVVAGYFAFLGGETGAPSVRRGDANDDGMFDVCDVVFTLEALFLEGTDFHCEDAADANDDEVLDLADPIFSATALFMSGTLPPSPGPFNCGVDATGQALGCDYSLICW